MNKNGLFRNIKLFMYNYLISIPQFLIIVPFLIVYWKMLNITIPAGGIAVLVMLITSLSIPMGSVTVTYKYVVGFSSTKRNFYIGCMLNKLLYTVLYTAVTVVLSVISNFYPLNTIEGMLLLVILSFALGALGEFYGLLMNRSQKMGFIVYLISFCSLAFAGLGVYVYYRLKYPDSPIMELIFNSFSYTAAYIIMAVIFAGLTAVNWKLYIKSELRS